MQQHIERLESMCEASQVEAKAVKVRNESAYFSQEVDAVGSPSLLRLFLLQEDLARARAHHERLEKRVIEAGVSGNGERERERAEAISDSCDVCAGGEGQAREACGTFAAANYFRGFHAEGLHRGGGVLIHTQLLAHTE
jgi:hypothetical protein